MSALTETITWVPVSERLPLEEVRVMVKMQPRETQYAAPIQVMFATCRNGKWIDDREWNVYWLVTHWAREPKGPK